MLSHKLVVMAAECHCSISSVPERLQVAQGPVSSLLLDQYLWIRLYAFILFLVLVFLFFQLNIEKPVETLSELMKKCEERGRICTCIHPEASDVGEGTSSTSRILTRQFKTLKSKNETWDTRIGQESFSFLLCFSLSAWLRSVLEWIKQKIYGAICVLILYLKLYLTPRALYVYHRTAVRRRRNKQPPCLVHISLSWCEVTHLLVPDWSLLHCWAVNVSQPSVKGEIWGLIQASMYWGYFLLLTQRSRHLKIEHSNMTPL